MTPADNLRSEFERWQRQSAMVGAGGLLICIITAFFIPEQVFRSYLVAFLFWVGIVLGSLATLMIYHLTGGAWGTLIRRFLESATRTLPVMAVLILPIIFGVSFIYVWARPDVVAHDALLKHKSLYLNIPFFVIRTIIYFAIWFALVRYLNRWSLTQAPQGKFEGLSGPGLVLFGLTVTFASVDWAMSLEPHWLSTVYGVLFMVGQVLASLAVMILIVALLANRGPLRDFVQPSYFHDLGNLMFAFVMLWAYISFSQFLIIWSGNLPEEITWYVARMRNGWEYVAIILLLFHFAVPFALLLSRRNKRNLRGLATIAAWMIIMRLVDLLWMVKPAFHPQGFAIHWLDIVAPVALGGIWLAAFLWQLKTRPLLPLP